MAGGKNGDTETAKPVQWDTKETRGEYFRRRKSEFDRDPETTELLNQLLGENDHD